MLRLPHAQTGDEAGGEGAFTLPELELMFPDTVKTKLLVSSPLR